MKTRCPTVRMHIDQSARQFCPSVLRVRSPSRRVRSGAGAVLLALLLAELSPHAGAQAPLGEVLQLDAGGLHTCALVSGGRVMCWGDNRNGQLGDNSTDDKLVAMPASAVSSEARTVTPGQAHTCIVTAGGGVQCWGQNVSGQLGGGVPATIGPPVEVTGLGSGVAAIDAGSNHTCALTVGGGCAVLGPQ